MQMKSNNSLSVIQGSTPVLSKPARKLSPRKRPEETSVDSMDIIVQKSCDESERLFQYFDENGDGKISPSELQSCMRTVGGELTSAEAVSVVESLDSDGDGLLGLDDFAKLMETNGEEEKVKDLREVFGMYAKRGSSCITPKSLKKMLSRLGEDKTIDECKGMISVFDLDGDGVLDFEEFRIMMT